MKVDLRVRNLKTTEDGSVSFEDEVLARAWLSSRPRFVEVLGVASYGLPDELIKSLRASTRELDADEKAAQRALDQANEAALRKRAEEKREKEVAEAKAHRESMKTADPDRAMEIHWTYDGGMKLSDAADPRPITEDARAAVMAWIAERNEWVRGRGQIVGEANVSVWPGKLPDGVSERVRQGSFFPCTAPETIH
jgi:hypothetical protein